MILDVYDGHEVDVSCLSEGRTWFTVRVRGVEGRVTKVGVEETGDCSGQRISRTKLGTTVIVRIENVGGDFECSYQSVAVSYR